MGRKKKETRKYVPRNEFRHNYSSLTDGHIHYVFGETKSKYKSMGLTHEPNIAYKQIRLSSNPNPSDPNPSYLEPNVKTFKKSSYGKPLSNWSFSKEDHAIVRHYKKRYKKSYNRKPPGYYDLKKKKK